MAAANDLNHRHFPGPSAPLVPAHVPTVSSAGTLDIRRRQLKALYPVSIPVLAL